MDKSMSPEEFQEWLKHDAIRTMEDLTKQVCNLKDEVRVLTEEMDTLTCSVWKRVIFVFTGRI